jgi:hypothetical protein
MGIEVNWSATRLINLHANVALDLSRYICGRFVKRHQIKPLDRRLLLWRWMPS